MRHILLLPTIILTHLLTAQTITVTSPIGGDTLIGAQTYTITWTTTGTIDSVDIYYRRSSTYLIESKVPNTGSYSWTVPSGIISSNWGYVRVKNSASSLYDENDAPFRFQEAPKSFTVIYPNALTDTIQAGEPNTITWNSAGYMTKVHLYYSLNGGINYTRFSPYSGATNNGSFVWTPSNSLETNNLKIKVEGYGANSTYFDESDNDAVLLKGKTLQITYPLSANFVAGTNRTITWNSSGGITAVDIEYSTDWGPWISIADSTDNDGTYNWTVPSDSSNSVRVRIIENGNATIQHILYNYTISYSAQTITVLTPNGGEIYTEGDSILITWNANSNLAGLQFQVDYSIDSGITWIQLDDNLAYNDSVWWTAPLHVPSTNCLVRVFKHNPAVMEIGDTSDATFTINLGPPSVILGTPNGGESYLSGSTNNVYYSTTGSIDSLDLYFSSDNGITWSLIKTGVDPLNYFTSFAYPDVQSNNCKLKLVDPNNLSIKDSSDNVFSLSKLKLTSPYNNQTFYSGATANINWNASSSITGPLTLYYSVDSGDNWILIDNNIPNINTYSWTIPNDSSYHCKVKIVDNANSAHYDSSVIEFNIIPSPVQVITPNGGEYWDANTTYPITWTTDPAASISNVRIRYSTNGGTSWSYVTSGTPNTGSYSWTTPNILSSNVLIKVENAIFSSTPYDISNAVFNIGITAPNSITVLSPNGGETLPTAGTETITWSTTGSVSLVDLYYSTDGGINWNTIATSETNDGAYDWAFSYVSSDKALIKIVENGDPLVKDSSDAHFNIGFYVHLLSPNGGESYIGTSVDTIYWDAASVLSFVQLEISQNSGANWSFITSSTPNTGKYAWTIPNITCTTCRVRIRNGVVASDYSETDFSITPYSGIELTSPNGGETFAEGVNYPITWNPAGITSNLNLFYSIDSGVTWLSIANGISNTGTYNWLIPTSSITNDALVKIEGY
jgi:hypothetical protein